MRRNVRLAANRDGLMSQRPGASAQLEQQHPLPRPQLRFLSQQVSRAWVLVGPLGRKTQVGLVAGAPKLETHGPVRR